MWIARSPADDFKELHWFLRREGLMKEAATTWHRMPALDGIRALAVMAVVLYHFQTRSTFPGGLFGVDVFFALSGFLITGLLITEWQSLRDVRLPRFYIHRVLRILPAAFCFIVIYLVFVLVFHPSTEDSGPMSSEDAVKNAGFALTYGYSWALVSHQFVAGGFTHLWSLSVEEQFYLLWPILLCSLLRLGARPSALLLLAGGLALFTGALPILLHWHSDESGWLRIYFGADYRSHTLLMGSCAGIAYATGCIRLQHVKSLVFKVSLFASAFFMIAVLFLATDERIYEFYRLGFPLVSLSATCIVLAAAFLDRGIWSSILSNPVLAHIGSRSYAIYLWHFPIGQFFRYFSTIEQLLLAGGLTIAAAELSHRLVERPALRLRGRVGLSRALQDRASARLTTVHSPTETATSA